MIKQTKLQLLMNYSNCLLIFVGSFLGLLPLGMSESFTLPSAMASNGVLSQDHSQHLSTLAEPIPVSTAPDAVDSMLKNTWHFVQWQRENVNESLVSETEITVEFSENKVSGSSGCNNYTGSYQTTQQQLTVGALASTRKACPLEIMEQESKYLTALQGAKSFDVKDSGNLHVSYQTAESSGILVFKPFSPPTTGGAWLEQKMTNWNQPNQAVPPAPIQDGSNLSNCSANFRPASLSEDQLVQDSGWTLYGSAYLFGSTTVVSGMANADGQCRPLEFQYFVFQNGNFIGTISPTVMNSRTDGSLFQINLFGENEISAAFNRYMNSDPMCCASQESRLFYTITETDRGLVLEPQFPATTNTVSK